MNLNRLFLPVLAVTVLACAAGVACGQGFETAELLPDKLENSEGKKISAETVEGKFIGLYFSAGWCPPCRAFTPRLVEFRNAHAGENFEVVFVSFDKSNMEKRKYVRKAEMPWPSIRGAGRREARQLSRRFQIEGLPTLVIISPDGQIVSMNGRQDIMSAPDTALEKWKKASQS